MITWENIKKNNIQCLKNYNNYNKTFNKLNGDFINVYNSSNFIKKYFLKKKAKVLKYNDLVVGFIWADSFRNIHCKINQFYTVSNFKLQDNKFDFWNIFNRYSSIIYTCEDNNINQDLLSNLSFKRRNCIVEMELNLKENMYLFNETKLPSSVSLEYFKEGYHEPVRCHIQNLIFESKNRIPLSLNDILLDEKQTYYILGGAIFLKFREEYIGYGQLIIEDGFLTIANFGVIPQYRKMGYGKLLLNELIKLSKFFYPEEEILKIKVFYDNKAAINLYKNMGFRVCKKVSTWVIKNSFL